MPDDFKDEKRGISDIELMEQIIKENRERVTRHGETPFEKEVLGLLWDIGRELRKAGKAEAWECRKA